jgi:predicted kinase
VIEVLVGMIASGKSTYARKRADTGAIVVCHDDLTEMVHACYRYDQALHETYHRMEESLVRHALDAGRDVVIDRTHLTLKSRARWVKFAAYHHSFVSAIVFPKESLTTHASRRYKSDSRGKSSAFWHGVARSHAGKFQPVGESEGFSRIIYLSDDQDAKPGDDA